MKIAHVQVIPQMSGVQQVSLDILNNLSNEHEKYIICGEKMYNSHSFFEKFTEAGINIVVIPDIKREIGVWDFRALIRLYRLFKKESFDIVHTNSTKSGIIGRIAARLAGVPKIIHTVHGISFHRHIPYISRKIFRWLENFSTIWGHHNITVNSIYRKEFALVKSEVIYNGVDFSLLNDVKSTEERTQLRVAFMARFDEQKNPFDFVKIASEYLKVYNDKGLPCVKFIMGGDGPLKVQCENLVRELNLQDYFDFYGWVEDKSDFLSCVDILLQPSRWEAFGLIFVEAGYFKIPTIASNVEGIPEVIVDGKTGLLFNEGEISTAANLLHQLISNQDMRVNFGINSRNHVTSNFNLDRMVSSYERLYFERE